MKRNHLIPSPTAPPTRGEEEMRAACEGNPEPFDILMDARRGDNVKYALIEARAMCNSCPLQAKCWTENADEPWLLAMRGEAKAPRRRVAECGTASGYTRHHRTLKEPACEACKRAHAAANAAAAKKREAAA